MTALLRLSHLHTHQLLIVSMPLPRAVVYNASNNELVRTKTLVKGAIIQIDATPFKQW